MDAHNNEYLAAVAALPDQTPSPRTFAPGQAVRVPKSFGCGYQVGVISHEEIDRHLGRVIRVDTQEGRLVLLPDEIDHI